MTATLTDCLMPLCTNRALIGSAHCQRHQRIAPPAPLRLTSPQAAAAERPIPPGSSAAAPTADVLITRGKTSTIAKVRRAADKAEAAVGALRAALVETAAEERRRAEQEREKAEAKAEVARLTAQLAAARERLKGPSTRVSAPTTTRAPSEHAGQRPDYDTRTVRAWCREHGVPCPEAGRFLPKEVVAAWRAATGSAE